CLVECHDLLRNAILGDAEVSFRDPWDELTILGHHHRVHSHHRHVYRQRIIRHALRILRCRRWRRWWFVFFLGNCDWPDVALWPAGGCRWCLLAWLLA